MVNPTRGGNWNFVLLRPGLRIDDGPGRGNDLMHAS